MEAIVENKKNENLKKKKVKLRSRL